MQSGADGVSSCAACAALSGAGDSAEGEIYSQGITEAWSETGAAGDRSGRARCGTDGEIGAGAGRGRNQLRGIRSGDSESHHSQYRRIQKAVPCQRCAGNHSLWRRLGYGLCEGDGRKDCSSEKACLQDEGIAENMEEDDNVDIEDVRVIDEREIEDEDDYLQYLDDDEEIEEEW